MKYFILPFLLFLIFSCSPQKDNYKIIINEKYFVSVELAERTTPDDLLLYAEKIMADRAEKIFYLGVNTCYIQFLIPSEYPVNPENEAWATVIYQKNGSICLKIYGARSNEHKKNLLALKFEADQLIGKWYYQLPEDERIIFIGRQDEQTVISEFRVESVTQETDPADYYGPPIYRKKISDMSITDFQHWNPYEEMQRNPRNPAELKIKGTKHWQYRIDKDNKLLFLDTEGKVYREAVPVK